MTTVLTADEEANALLVGDPWGFLCGVICDYQMPADRAWATPYNLAQRLGGFSVELIATHPERVHAAFLGPPAIHRFPNQTTDFVVEGARRVLDEYGGDAAAVWSDEPTARELQDRLVRFNRHLMIEAMSRAPVLNLLPPLSVRLAVQPLWSLVEFGA